MKKILLIVTVFISATMADSVLLVKKGWQLIGSSTPLTDMSKFKSDSVEQVWHFDARTQKWLGFSPDSEIQAKMKDKNISKLGSLENWHGFWVKSKKEWGLLLDDSTLEKAPSNENLANDIIQLKKGWNLISLPVNSVVSADIFGDMTVWKYNSNGKWEFSDSEQSSEDFPKLSHIKNSDGFWVKAPQDTNISVMQEASKLHNFATKEEMESYIKEMAIANYHPYCGIEPPMMDSYIVNDVAVPTEVSTEADTSGTLGGDVITRDSSNTNLQESGVDEADIVKHDGIHIFYTSNGSNRVNLTTFSRLAKGDTAPFYDINISQNIDSLYLTNNRLIVISKSDSVWIHIFDVSDINNIKEIDGYKIDGILETSRVIGDNLYLISNFAPQLDISYPKIEVELSPSCREYFYDSNRYYDEDNDYSRYAECFNIVKDSENRYYRYDYDNPITKIKKLIPQISGNGLTAQALIEPSKLYASSKQNQSATMTTITNISISDGSYKNSNSFVGYSFTQYASPKAFYLVSNEYPIYYDFNNYKERSTIYKFDLDDELKYKGLGSVYGQTLNQFSLSEYNDILRIATTERFSFGWWTESTNNSIYTLKEQNGKLSIQGVLSGLGKERESIKSVRFIGDKGFVVTYEQTDPFYTIDMSDPTQPKKVGELKVNGYSAYLHPVGDDKILGFGRDADSNGVTQGVKIELFDISDFANPTSLDSIVLNKNTYSEIEENHKALAYRYSDNLFAFPYHQWRDYQNESRVEFKNDNYLGVYQVENNLLKKYQPIKSSGKYSWGNSRGLIFDMNSTTYISFFTNDKVITTELNSTVE